MICVVILASNRAPFYQDVVSWCRNNNIDVPWAHLAGKEHDKIVYKFINDEDATAFRLRFG